MIKIIIFGIIGLVVLFSVIYLYEITFRKFPIGIDEIKGDRGSKMIENFNITNVVGFSAAILTTIAFLPQLLKTLIPLQFHLFSCILQQ